jgi:crotonobetainyl-CoA:carnitine CoA-transferase CaiB-like acyl-CoA transferase
MEPVLPETTAGQGNFHQWNQGKRSVRLNLEMPKAVAIAKSRAVHCDLMVENFARGVIARMRLGYEVLREIRSEIIMLHCPKCQGLARADWPRERPPVS